MEGNIKKFLPQIQELLDAKNKTRAKILSKASPEFTKFLCEVVLNVLKGNIQLAKPHYKKLRRYRYTLLNLCKRKKSLKYRKNLLLKKAGGFLPIILPALISAIAGFAGEAISSSINGKKN
jgi:hypothetical protein